MGSNEQRRKQVILTTCFRALSKSFLPESFSKSPTIHMVTALTAFSSEIQGQEFFNIEVHMAYYTWCLNEGTVPKLNATVSCCLLLLPNVCTINGYMMKVPMVDICVFEWIYISVSTLILCCIW